MCKVPYSLIGQNGYTEADAVLVCTLLRRDAPVRPSLEKVLALERETTHLPAVPQAINHVDILKEYTPQPVKRNIPRTKVVNRPKPDDYPSPWCKVFKDGKLIRYEDASGKPIPEILWRGK